MMGDRNTCSYCGERIREPEAGSFGYYCGFLCMKRDERRIHVGITLMLAILLAISVAALHIFGVIQLV